jgi:hypothetical protein
MSGEFPSSAAEKLDDQSLKTSNPPETIEDLIDSFPYYRNELEKLIAKIPDRQRAFRVATCFLGLDGCGEPVSKETLEAHKTRLRLVRAINSSPTGGGAKVINMTYATE